MEKDKDSGAKGRSEAMSDTIYWEVLGDVFEWGSGSIGKTKGGAAAEKSTVTIVWSKITATIGTVKTVKKSEVI